MLCLDCVSIDKTKCTYPGCDNLYEMQSPDSMARPENPNPKWSVPQDLIELQPSYAQAWLLIEKSVRFNCIFFIFVFILEVFIVIVE